MVDDQRQRSVTPTLDYGRRRRDIAPIVTHEADGGVTVVVPTRRSLAGVLLGVVATDLWGFLLTPFALVAYLLLATRRPRAVITITDGVLSIRETGDFSLGRIVARRSWPLADVSEWRPNRFGAGLYVVIRGRDSFDLLTDRSPADLQLVASIVDEVRAQQTGQTGCGP